MMKDKYFFGKPNITRLLRTIFALTLTAAVTIAASGDTLLVSATTEKELQENINSLNQQINDINNNISSMEEEQDILEEEMEDLNAEIINTMTTISLKEDEIAEKETEITDKQTDIDEAETEYEEAKAQAEQQYEDTVARVKKMYQQGDAGYVTLLLEGNGLSEMLNRMDFVEGVYEYDREKLTEYQEMQQQVLDLWNQLEEEKNALETAKADLETEEAELESQKADLDTLLTKKKQQSDNYDAEIKKARQEASVAKTQLQQEQAELKRLQAAKKSTANTAATSGSYTTTDYTSVIESASGSDLGKNIAKYACQFIGNPYVAGGTSLTNGADCSGFTYRIYSDFGYSIPRTSTQQRSAGTGVSYSEAQPGDLICYSGHVALYIGGGLIVHASTAKSGIKISNAQYREILAVRRII